MCLRFSQPAVAVFCVVVESFDIPVDNAATAKVEDGSFHSACGDDLFFQTSNSLISTTTSSIPPVATPSVGVSMDNIRP